MRISSYEYRNLLAERAVVWHASDRTFLTFEKSSRSSHSRSWGTDRSRKNLALSVTPDMVVEVALYGDAWNQYSRNVEETFASVQGKSINFSGASQAGSHVMLK